ncbi:MAG: DsbA family protein, partial [Betaproteobacteria bacterium]|nr:DsbA family protein [Betaproteobacteria bacterium]
LVAAHMQHGVAEAMGLAGALLRAVWAEEKNIADPETLAALIKTRGLPADLLAISAQEPTAKQYQANTDEAIAVGVFGSPTYVVDGELFWGQDRLDLLARCLGVTP